jgi:hypothetical protein
MWAVSGDVASADSSRRSSDVRPRSSPIETVASQQATKTGDPALERISVSEADQPRSSGTATTDS